MTSNGQATENDLRNDHDRLFAPGSPTRKERTKWRAPPQPSGSSLQCAYAPSGPGASRPGARQRAPRPGADALRPLAGVARGFKASSKQVRPIFKTKVTVRRSM